MVSNDDRVMRSTSMRRRCYARPVVKDTRSVVAVLLAVSACTSSSGGGRGVSDASVDGATEVDAGPDARSRDLANGESCVVSAQCRGACCELTRGNTTVCAQITPFDRTQSCTCEENAECAAITLCGNPGFCQENNQVAPQRFCSHLCK